MVNEITINKDNCGLGVSCNILIIINIKNSIAIYTVSVKLYTISTAILVEERRGLLINMSYLAHIILSYYYP